MAAIVRVCGYGLGGKVWTVEAVVISRQLDVVSSTGKSSAVCRLQRRESFLRASSHASTVPPRRRLTLSLDDVVVTSALLSYRDDGPLAYAVFYNLEFRLLDIHVQNLTL